MGLRGRSQLPPVGAPSCGPRRSAARAAVCLLLLLLLCVLQGGGAGVGTVFVDKYKVEWDVVDSFDSVNGLPLSFSSSRLEILPECSTPSLCVGTSPEVSPLGVQVCTVYPPVCCYDYVPVSTVVWLHARPPGRTVVVGPMLVPRLQSRVLRGIWLW